jgi:hypothetical protein
MQARPDRWCMIGCVASVERECRMSGDLFYKSCLDVVGRVGLHLVPIRLTVHPNESRS